LNKASKRRLDRLDKIAILIALVLGATVAVLAAEVYINASPCQNVPSGHYRSFVIIANATGGFNNSRNEPLIVNARVGDCVTINFVNWDTQAHGIAIATYYPSGVTCSPGETKSIIFQATTPGQFPISEPVFTTTYSFDRGMFNVTQ
jgi:hypothetical protein